MPRKNVFPIARDCLNLAKLKSLERFGDYRIHPVLDFKDVQGEHPPADHGDPEPGGTGDRFVFGHQGCHHHVWDFPVSCLLPILCDRFGVPSPSLESVIKCYHKYWSRIVQRKVAPECTPKFSKVDLNDDQALSKIELDLPFWLKPVKAFRSQLAFKINDERDFHGSTGIIREKIPRFSKPFDFFLERVATPNEIASAHGGFCIAEEVIEGRQGALEGYV